MKNLVLFLMISLVSECLTGETVKTIGTHGGSRELPFGMYYGFERSAAIYTFSEIQSYGFITSLGWEVQAGKLESCPVKIYLNTTSSSTLSQMTWNNMIVGATLVYDATTSFPNAGWQTIDITDFVYSSNNLLVLCETNYGANPPLDYPWFWYSNSGSTNKHEFWRNNNTVPLGNGTTDKLRPNIQITYLPLSDHNPPSGFRATAAGSSKINLTWIKNSAGDNVMIAYNTANTFGIPNTSTTYVPGNSISGGGTVIYNGPGTSMSDSTNLSPATTYYFMAWSVYSTPPSYSPGVVTFATTLCEATNTYPYITDFETINFPPSCWSLAGKPWTRAASYSGYGNGSASSTANFFSIAVGNFDLISPGLDLSSMITPVVKFDHAYATGVNQVDRLELWYSTDNGSTYTLLYTWLGGINGPLNTGGAISISFLPSPDQWSTKYKELPDTANKIMLRGVSAYGNNLYLDNIDIYDAGITVWNGSISSAWNNPLNWTPNGVPNELQTVAIPPGMQHNPTINVTGMKCKKLTINSGAIVTVGSSSEIAVSTDLTIQMGATLKNMGLVTVNGTLYIIN
jgi:hypothetical protein